MIPEDIEEVTLLFDDGQVRFPAGDVEVTSRLIDGNFPDYAQLIPKATEITATVQVSELVRITKIGESICPRERRQRDAAHQHQTRSFLSTLWPLSSARTPEAEASR